MRRACSMKGKKRDEYRVFAGKPEGETPLGSPD
jgi:hypothetical protein